MDLFSQLPEHLIHRILNFLPTKEATRTSVLSKSWKSAWDSRPWDSRSRVFLDLRKFKDDGIDKSLEFIRKSLETYIEQGIGVEDLTVSWNALVDYDNQIFDSMNQWINFAFAAGNNLKRLAIIGSFFYRKRGIDRFGFSLNLRSSNTLTTLNLIRCKLADTSETIKFPSLQNLILTDTPLNSDIIDKIFLSGSPLLERLSLSECKGLRSLEVSGLVRITSILVHNCSRLKRVDIQAPNLRDFSLSSRSTFKSTEIKLAACEESLKYLKLVLVKLPTDDKYWLQTMVSRFVSLETLYLNNLDIPLNKEAIEISSLSLRELVIRNCKDFDEDTVINAPNLRSVKFVNNNYPLYSLPKSKNLSRLCFSGRAEQSVDALWRHKLKELLAETNHIKAMSMTIRCRKERQNIFIFHEDFSYLMLCKIIDNLEYLNHDLEFTIEKSSLSCFEDKVERLNVWMLSSRDAIYIASSSSSSHNTYFIKDDNICRWKRNLGCRPYGRHLKDIQSEEINLEQDITNIRDEIDAALLQEYQILSYKLTRITVQYDNKRRR